MTKRVEIQLFLDFDAFGRSLIDLLGQATARGIVNTIKRRNKPRLTGDLMDSVRDERISKSLYEVSTDLPYSAAQEYGRPDLQSYTYTPYMGPGALDGTAGAKMEKYVAEATNGAASRAKR